MANRTVVVDLIVNTSRWTAGFQKASHDMTSATTNAQTKAEALQRQVGLLGVGLTGFAALAVRKWAQFDQAMSRVEATGGSAADRINDLTEAAKSDEVTQLGYSATEASESIYELTKAGVGATDIIGGGLAGALSLAAAETMDAAESASILASAMTQFDKGGEDAAHVADLITAAAGKAQGSAHDLGFALKQSGLVANQFGLSIEETTGSLALFANAGLIGSDAGTSLRTMLLHLAGPSGRSAELMDEMGFSAYNANGQFKSMEELANSLQTALKGKSEEEKNAALVTWFGADATRAASLLYREGGDAVAEWTAKVNDAGYAQDVARKRMDNLNGDIKILNSTWEKFLIGMGESADAPLRELVQGITAVVSAFDELPPAAQGIIMALAGGGGLGILGVLAIGQVMNALTNLQTGLVMTGKVSEATATRITNGMKTATLAMGVLGAAATIGFTGWALAVAEAEAAVDGYVATLDEAAQVTDATTKHISQILTEGQDLGWNDFFGNYDLIANAEKMGVAVEDLAGYILGEADAVDRVNAAWQEYTGSGWGSFDRSIDVEQMQTALENQAGTLADAKKEKELQAEVNEKLGASETETGGAVEDATGAIEDQTDAIQDNIDAWNELAGVHMSADESIANYEQAIDDAREAIHAASTDTEKYSELLGRNRKSLDLNTQAGRDAQDALLGIADAALKQMQAQYDAGTSTADLTKQMSNARGQFIKAAESAGLTRESAERLADSYGLIPENVETSVNAVDNASGPISGIKRELDGLKDKTIHVTTIRDFIGTAGGGASQYVMRAGGGSIPMVQGAKPGVDSVPVLAMPGEHMLTVQDVNAMGGQQAVHAFRKALHSGTGMIGMARGGAVPGKSALRGHSLSFWASKLLSKSEELSLRARVRDLGNDLKAKGDDRLRGLDRRIAEEELKQAKKELYFGDYAKRLGSAKDFQRWMSQAERKADAREAEHQRQIDRWQANREVNKQIIRGEIRDSLTSGLSGVYSVTDQAQGYINEGTVKGGAADRLQKAIWNANSAARSLYGNLDKVETKLEAARAKAEELRQIQDSVASGLVGGFSLSNLEGSVNPWSGEKETLSGTGMLRGAQSYAGKVRKLAEKLQALQKKGFTGAILQEIAGMGVDEGIAAADELLALGKEGITAFNAAYASIDYWSSVAGKAVTGGLYKGGVAAAEGIVAGLESQQAQLEKAIEKMAKGMQDALKKALGIKSPSRVFRDLMKPVGDGAVIGLQQQTPRVSAAAADLLKAASGNYVGAGSFSGVSARSYSAGSYAQNITKNINIDVKSYNAVAEKDSVITNRALQTAAAIGD